MGCSCYDYCEFNLILEADNLLVKLLGAPLWLRSTLCT